jgi:hypothetical protein
MASKVQHGFKARMQGFLQSEEGLSLAL